MINIRRQRPIVNRRRLTEGYGKARKALDFAWDLRWNIIEITQQ